MSRVSVSTLLSIEQFAEILQLEPRHFQSVYAPVHFPVNNAENSVWFQHAWQETTRLCRDELARAIAQAEHLIAQQLGFWPAPVWIEDEIHEFPFKQYVPERALLVGNPLPASLGQFVFRAPTIQAIWGRFIAGGRRALDPIADNVVVDYVDNDGDGYDESVEITILGVPTAGMHESEITVFVHGAEALDEYRIRNLHTAFTDATTIVITGNSELFIEPALWEQPGGRAIDGSDPANFVDFVDVYRLYNSAVDNANAPVVFGRQDPFNVTLPAFAERYGVLQVYNRVKGTLTIYPATWDDTAGAWTVDTCASPPDLVRLYYYAGVPTDRQGRVVEPFARAIASLATALITKPLNTYGPPDNLMSWWQSIPGERAELARQLCPWGPKQGAWEAFQMLTQTFAATEGTSL